MYFRETANVHPRDKSKDLETVADDHPQSGLFPLGQILLFLFLTHQAYRLIQQGRVEKNPVQSSGATRFPFCASNISCSLAHWVKPQTIYIKFQSNPKGQAGFQNSIWVTYSTLLHEGVKNGECETLRDGRTTAVVLHAQAIS